MSDRSRTFVGFGFGPIQAGLFLTEAYRSGNFARLVVAEILPEIVDAVDRAHGFTVNIGHADRIEALTVRPVEIHSPRNQRGRSVLIDAIAGASELATALPSVDFYTHGGAASVQAILAEGLLRKVTDDSPLAVIYTAENNTRAAELLEEAVLAALPAGARDAVLRRVQFLDTIIGKMSGAPDATEGLAMLAPGLGRAYLVEAFNRILITAIRRPGDADMGRELDSRWRSYARGITVFSEKRDLAPFAEAKLYGHNAGHALAAYLARLLGFVRIDELRQRPDVLNFVLAAMVEESGAPLVERYRGVDPLFTNAGFRAYTEDLVARMVNPFVRDTVARVGRDPARKLGWHDRLIGAMRLALAGGVEPLHYAWGAAAALSAMGVPASSAAAALADLWRPDDPDPALAGVLLAYINSAYAELDRWAAAGFAALPTAK